MSDGVPPAYAEMERKSSPSRVTHTPPHSSQRQYWMPGDKSSRESRRTRSDCLTVRSVFMSSGTLGARKVCPSIHVEIPPNHKMSGVVGAYVVEQLIRGLTRVVIQDQQLRLRRACEGGQLRDRRVELCGELLKVFGRVDSQPSVCTSWINTSQPLHASMVACVGFVSPVMTMVRSAV
jgi:hypothetical protein